MRNLFLPHYQSAHILAFGYALLASEASELIKANMLEEMGQTGEEAHPKLLLRLLEGAGFGESEVAALIDASREQARAFCAQQLPFSTLRDVGLAVLLEAAAFEHFLSRYATAMGEALRVHYGLSRGTLQWFELHGELDIRHSKESITVLQEYARFHRLGDAEVGRIRQAVFATNPLAKRYFPAKQGPGFWSSGARIEAITVYRLHIPFRESFRHAQMDRSASDALVVRVRDRDGHVGYGEALPRDYVTGEDTRAVLAFVEARLAPWVFGAEFRSADDVWRFLEEEAPRVAGSDPARPALRHNAALCALDLALLDWAFRREGASVARRLPPVRREVVYSGVVSAEEERAAADLARRFADAGIRHIKVKVGVGDDVARLRAVRDAIGGEVGLRVDANGAWDVETAVERIQQLVPFGIESVEQPASHRLPDAAAALREIRERTGVPLVADESAVTVEDVHVLADAGACDVVNVRVSKNGGLVAAHRIAQAAIGRGLKVQVGAQVGETAILTAAGRHLAATLQDIEHAEGSFGTLLLSEDVAEQELRFGLGGAAPILEGPGLGVDVRQDVLERLSVQTIELTG
jgi:muconate cycloisomerase